MREDPGTVSRTSCPSVAATRSGSLAMANAGPDTNGSQFFVISGSQGVSLPPLYSLFGKAVSGLDVLAAIDAVGTGSGTPKERVVIERVEVSEAD